MCLAIRLWLMPLSLVTIFSGNLTDSNISSYTPPPSAGQSLRAKVNQLFFVFDEVLPMILKLGHFAYQNCKKELVGWINDIMTVFNPERRENLNGDITSADLGTIEPAFK